MLGTGAVLVPCQSQWSMCPVAVPAGASRGAGAGADTGSLALAVLCRGLAGACARCPGSHSSCLRFSAVAAVPACRVNKAGPQLLTLPRGATAALAPQCRHVSRCWAPSLDWGGCWKRWGLGWRGVIEPLVPAGSSSMAVVGTSGCRCPLDLCGV